MGFVVCVDESEVHHRGSVWLVVNFTGLSPEVVSQISTGVFSPLPYQVLMLHLQQRRVRVRIFVILTCFHDYQKVGRETLPGGRPSLEGG